MKVILHTSSNNDDDDHHNKDSYNNDDNVTEALNNIVTKYLFTGSDSPK